MVELLCLVQPRNDRLVICFQNVTDVPQMFGFIVIYNIMNWFLQI